MGRMTGATAPADTTARRRKLAEIVAERIVEEIIQRGWRAGDMLGTEADFIERYRISRATFREAVRQLEWHGAAGMKRGASGGLVVNAPPRLAAIFAIKAYFAFAGIDASERNEASEVLRHANQFGPDRTENQAIELFLEAADDRTVGMLPEQRQPGSAAPKLSERITLALVQDIQTADTVRGTVIGNEAGLQQRFGVSRAILREALRPLELHDVVRVKSGAQGGVVVHRVDPAYTIDITGTYFAYVRIPLSQTWEAHSSMALAAIDGLVRQETIPTTELRRALGRLEAATAGHYIVASSELHRVLVDFCGNRVIALFGRILLHYFSATLPRPDARFLPMLKDAHRRLVDAIEARDAATARHELAAAFDHSRRWIRKVESGEQNGRQR